MTAKPSPHAVITEMEQALTKSQDQHIRRMVHATDVFEFLDTQRMKVEQGRWSPMSYTIDRLKLASTKQWRQSPENAREQVAASLVNLGGRIQLANEMKSFIEQVVEVGEMMVAQLPQGVRDFANKLSQRRQEQTPEDTISHRPRTP
jgi:hypothetical protein